MLGTAPHRRGRPYNETEYEARRVEAMIEMLDPGRPRSMTGGLLSERAAADARTSEHVSLHPEVRVRPPAS